MSDIQAIKDGYCAIFVGNTGFIKEFSSHPQVRFIDTKIVTVDLLESLVPVMTKAIILTEGISKPHYMWGTSFCNRKKIPFLIRKSNEAIYQTLKSMFPVDSSTLENANQRLQDVARETREKGKLEILVQYIDWNKSNAENARHLHNKCFEHNIKTTFGSLTQFISIKRRKLGMSDKPRSTRSQLDLSVEMFDRFIDDATAMRDYVIALAEENRILKQKVEKFKKALEE